MVILPSFALALDDMPSEIPSERLLPRFVDEANLLYSSEEEELLAELDEISERQQVDVVIITLDSIPPGYTPMQYADDIYDYYGYGFGANADGILLMISMEERDWRISTCGFGIRAFTDAGQAYMSDKFLSYLSNGSYYTAFHTFAELCDEFITQAKTGKPYDVGNLPKEKLSPTWIVFALVIGFILSFIPVGVMKGELKTVKMQAGASNYARKDSLNIVNTRNTFLYHKVRRTPRQTQSSSHGGGSSTHHSSSGRSHGGSGGKF